MAKKPGYPTKKEERSPTEGVDDVLADDKTPPPELARSMTVSEAKQLIAVRLKPIDVRWLETKICGTDLITHAWGPKAKRQMLARMQMTEAEKKLAARNREKRDPDSDFQEARYHWDGKDWFPTNGIKKAMVTAGYALGIPRSLIQRSLFVIGETRRDYVEIKYTRIVQREDAVQVKDRMGKKSADLRYRPEYQDWSALLRIKYRADLIDEQQVLTLLRDAGFSIGIGEWRPERDGQFGTFDIEGMADIRSSKEAPAKKSAKRRAA